MAVYDHQEREQIEDIKAWWREWGAYVTTGVAIVAVLLAGFTAWRQWQTQRNDAASVLYFEVAESIEINNEEKASAAMKNLVAAYGGTGYAPRAAFLYARLLWDAGKTTEAQNELQWIIKNAGEAELVDIARYRLATTLVDQKSYDEALTLLTQKHKAVFTPLFSDLQGDALMAKGNLKDAVAAYEKALAQAPETADSSQFWGMLRMKTDWAKSKLPASSEALALQSTEEKTEPDADKPAVEKPATPEPAPATP